jgi:hypothetical protein
MSLNATSLPRALPPPTPPGRQGRRAPFWRGAAGAFALAAWSLAGVLGAVLALLPVALERGPRGRIPRIPEAPQRADEAAAHEVPAARAAGEAFPG